MKTECFLIFSAKCCKKHRFCNVFCNPGSKNKEKQMFFQHFQQRIAKSTGLFFHLGYLCRAQSECKKRKTSGFSICSAKYCKKHRLCRVFLQSECKKPRETDGFSIFSANYCKKHRFCNVFCSLSSKNQGKPTVFQNFQQNVAKSIA